MLGPFCPVLKRLTGALSFYNQKPSKFQLPRLPMPRDDFREKQLSFISKLKLPILLFWQSFHSFMVVKELW